MATMTPLTPSHAGELLAIEVAGAWARYLRVTRNLHPWQYAEVEPAAWADLQLALREIESRRGLGKSGGEA